MRRTGAYFCCLAMVGLIFAAGLGGRCTGTVAVPFVAAAVGAKSAYVAEDFTTTRILDRTAGITTRAST